MKILLLSAAYLNGGAYVDAGTDVTVGDGKNEITEARAEEIVVANRAEVMDEVVDDEDAGEGEGGEGGDASADGGDSRPRRGRRQA